MVIVMVCKLDILVIKACNINNNNDIVVIDNKVIQYGTRCIAAISAMFILVGQTSNLENLQERVFSLFNLR